MLPNIPRLTISVISANTQTLLTGTSTTCVGETLTWHEHQVNLICEKCGKYFRTVDVTPTQYPRTAPLKQGPSGLQEVGRQQKTEEEGQENCSQSSN